MLYGCGNQLDKSLMRSVFDSNTRLVWMFDSHSSYSQRLHTRCVKWPKIVNEVNVARFSTGWHENDSWKVELLFSAQTFYRLQSYQRRIQTGKDSRVSLQLILIVISICILIQWMTETQMSNICIKANSERKEVLISDIRLHDFLSEIRTDSNRRKPNASLDCFLCNFSLYIKWSILMSYFI